MSTRNFQWELEDAGDFLSMAFSGAGAAQSAAGMASGINEAAKAYRQWKEINVLKNLEEGGSTTFYTVQNGRNVERLLSDGQPWPTKPEKANLGDGVYAWDNMDDAQRYMERKQGRTSEPLTILRFEVNNSDLNSMRTFDSRGLTDNELNNFFDQYARLYGGTPNHGYDHIINETNMGVEHYFDKTIFEKLNFWGKGGQK